MNIYFLFYIVVGMRGPDHGFFGAYCSIKFISLDKENFTRVWDFERIIWFRKICCVDIF